LLNSKELSNPTRLESVPFNVRMHRKADELFRKIYAKFYPTKHKYTQTKLMTIAILYLDQGIKENKIKAGDDIANKLGL